MRGKFWNPRSQNQICSYFTKTVITYNYSFQRSPWIASWFFSFPIHLSLERWKMFLDFFTIFEKRFFIFLQDFFHPIWLMEFDVNINRCCLSEPFIILIVTRSCIISNSKLEPNPSDDNRSSADIFFAQTRKRTGNLSKSSFEEFRNNHGHFLFWAVIFCAMKQNLLPHIWILK